MDANKEKTFEKREELVNVAMIEFGEKGYENASLNNILRKAGISKGTFYYHYKNKEDLYMYLMNIILEEKLKFMSKQIDLLKPDYNVFTKLELLIKAGMKFADKNPNINKFAQSYIKETSTEAYNKRMAKYYMEEQDFIEDTLKKYGFKSMDYIGDMIEEGFIKGEIRKDLPKDFIKQIVNYTFSHLQQLSNADDLEEYETAATNLVQILKDGIGRR